MNAFLDRQARANIGDAGRASEKKTARRLGMRQTIASGATPIQKGDIVGKEFLIEAKSTANASLSLKLDWLSTIAVEATDQGKEPALTITFTDPSGRPVRRGRWVLIEEDLFRRMIPIVESEQEF